MELPDVPLYDLEDDLWRETTATGEPRLRVYSVPEALVVLGRGSRLEVELRLEECLADGVPLRRRRGGGCAVVLDPGNAVVALTLPVEGLGQNLEHFRRLNHAVIDSLARLGVEGLGQDGVSDLVLGDRKVGGTCIHRTRGVLHYSASLLVEPRLELIERYLAHPPREPEYRRGRDHGAFLASLGERARSAGMADFVSSLARELAPLARC